MEVVSKPFLEVILRALECYEKVIEEERDSLFESHNDPDSKISKANQEIGYSQYVREAVEDELRNKH